MSKRKFDDQAVQHLLEHPMEHEVPKQLLEQLVADIPEELELHPDLSGAPRRKPALYRRPWALAAAAVFAVAITGSLSWEVYQRSIPHLRESIARPAPPARPNRVEQTKLTNIREDIDHPVEASSGSEEAAAAGSRSKAGQVTRENTNAKPMNVVPQKPARAEAGNSPQLRPRSIQVVDPDGALIPGVEVDVKSPEEKIVETAITDAEGRATILLPENRDYVASVSLPGFATQEVELPGPGKERSPDTKVQLELGPVTDVIEVTAETPVVNVRSTVTACLVETSKASVRRDKNEGTTRGKRSMPGKTLDEKLIHGYADAPPPAPPSTGGEAAPAPRVTVPEGRTATAQEKSLPKQRHIFVADGTPYPPSSASPSTGGESEPNAQPYGDVFFSSEGVNPFVDTEDDALSTFGLEVDTASYAVTRRYLDAGHLPPPEAVRVEEFLNSFDYGDPPPRHGDFRLILEGAPSAFAPGRGYVTLRVGIRAREVRESQRPPAVLVFCVDVSGSMAGGNRLGLVKRALVELLDHLRPDDRVGLVVYGSRGRVLLDPTTQHRNIRRAIDRLEPGGSTNAEEGLVLAYRLLDEYADGRNDGRILRVILCSDGVANTGSTGADEILEKIRMERQHGIELSTVGFGMGNYNDILMERLADAGDGRYAYVDSIDEARKIFVDELTGNLLTIGRDAKAQMEFDPDVVTRWRLIGYENRDIEDSRFRDPTVDAGEIGAGHAVTALYQIKLRSGISRRDTVATLHMRYQPRGSSRPVELQERIRVQDLASRRKDASPALRVAEQVAAFAELLRHSYWSRSYDFDDVLAQLEQIRRPPLDPSSMDELEAMVHRAARIDREDRYRKDNE